MTPPRVITVGLAADAAGRRVALTIGPLAEQGLGRRLAAETELDPDAAEAVGRDLIAMAARARGAAP